MFTIEKYIKNICIKFDRVFAALSDLTRRKIEELLNVDDVTILDLTTSFDMSFQAVSKHVSVLQKANLIEKRKQGKYYVCSNKPDAINEMMHWISKPYQLWKDGFKKLEELIDKNRLNDN